MGDFTKRLIAIIICVFLLVFAAIKAFSQELPKEPISKWVTDEMIYWHKDLPYYVFISEDSTGSMDMLHSKKQKKYSEPAYFDTYGLNFIRTKWAVDKITHKTVQPQQEIEWPVFVDGIAPETEPKFTSKSAYLVNGVRYFTKDLVMELSANDLNSGVRNTYYSINDSVYIKYDRPINLNPKDTFKVKYFSVDNVGNYEKPKIFAYNADDYNIKYAIDAFPPVTKLVTKLIRGKYLGPNMPIEFSSKDRGSGVAFTNYIIDDGEIKVYEKPFMLALPEGTHSLKFFSVDRITNKENEHLVRFIVDSTGPNLYIAAAGGYFSRDSIMYVSDSTKIRLSASDHRGIKQIAYKFSDDKSYKPYTGPLMLPKDYKARQDLRYFATDSTENDSKVHVVKLHRDISKPRVKFVITGSQYFRNDTIYVTNQTKFSRANYDSLSGIATDKLFRNDTLVKQVEFDKEIVYCVKDTVVDNIGNTTVLHQVYKRDSESPVINFTFSGPHILGGAMYPKGTILFFSITDSTGIESFKIAVNGKFISNGGPFTGPPGDYHVEVVATDYLQQSATKSVVFSIR